MSSDTIKKPVAVPASTILSTGLLCQLERDAIDIEVTKGGDIKNPFDTSIFTLAPLDDLCKQVPNAMTEEDFSGVVSDYFAAIDLDSSHYEWVVLKNNVKGFLVNIGKYPFSTIATFEGIAYASKKDLLQLLGKAEEDHILDLFDCVSEQVPLILDKYNAWRGNWIYNATLTYAFDNGITNSVSNILEPEVHNGGFHHVEKAVKFLHAELASRIRKEACTLSITIDLDRDVISEIEGCETPFQYIEQQFYDQYDIKFSMVCAETPLVFNSSSETLFIGEHKYNVARKELSFTVDPHRVPLFQSIYNKASSPLIRFMSESLAEASDYGWIVMKDLMSGNRLQEWEPSVVDAFWDAMFRDIPHAYNPRCEITR